MIKFIKDLWMVYVERAKARKAVRVLVKQAWSIEFLIYVLTKSVDMSKKQCHAVLRNPDGQELIIYAGLPNENKHSRKESELDVTQAGISWEAVRDAAEVAGVL